MLLGGFRPTRLPLKPLKSFTVDGLAPLFIVSVTNSPAWRVGWRKMAGLRHA